jgi:hypothetical protein
MQKLINKPLKRGGETESETEMETEMETDLERFLKLEPTFKKRNGKPLFRETEISDHKIYC